MSGHWIHWTSLRKQIAERTFEPFKSPSYFFYFLVVIIGAGAAGFWLELVQLQLNFGGTLKATKTALITYFWTLAITSCMQIVWSTGTKKNYRTFTMTLGFGCFLIAIACILSENKNVIFSWGSFAFIISLWMWWMANATPTTISDNDIDDQLTLGGNTKNQLAGGLDAFTH